MIRRAISLGLLLASGAGAGSCGNEERMGGPHDERLWTIEYAAEREKGEPATLLFTLYSSGLIDLQQSEGNRPLPWSKGWNQVEDLVAYQTLFDRAKDALRSQPGGVSRTRSTAGVTVTVRTTVALYTFHEDILKLDQTPLPKTHPFEFEKDGHSEEWSALKSSPVIDTRVRP